MGRYLIEEIVHEWGTSKTIQFILITIVGASVFGSVAAIAIPNKPMLIEKEND